MPGLWKPEIKMKITIDPIYFMFNNRSYVFNVSLCESSIMMMLNVHELDVNIGSQQICMYFSMCTKFNTDNDVLCRYCRFTAFKSITYLINHFYIGDVDSEKIHYLVYICINMKIKTSTLQIEKDDIIAFI